MTTVHGHERILNTFDYNGTVVDLVEWSKSIWCGKVGYAKNNTDEPDVERIMDDFMSEKVQSVAPNSKEDFWDVCMSINYLSDKRPSGVFFGWRVDSDTQPDCFDVINVPSGLYMRVEICEKTFSALKVEPWTGGIPPYKWIGEKLAPKFDMKYGDDTYPIFEYYGHNKQTNDIEVCYLYVPVQNK